MTPKPKPFKYKVHHQVYKPAPFGTISRANYEEQLSGLIGGNKASDIEERFYRALAKNPHITGTEFRYPVIAGRNQPGQLEVDFVVSIGPLVYAYQVDGDYAHKGIGKKQDDARKDELVNQYMKRFGAQPVKRIPGDTLRDQDAADRVVKELLQ